MDRSSVAVDFGLLSRLSHLLLCPRCLRQGVKTPVTQVISHRHRLRTLCRDCRAAVGPKPRRLPAPVLIF
jgi:superfamily II helicase